MKVVIATDRAFLAFRGAYYDTTCFGRPFFDDYLRVFDEATVVARSEEPAQLPAGAARSDGDKVRFRTLPNHRQIRWAIAGRLPARRVLTEEISDAGAVVARVPSELGWWAACEARRRKKPYMIEVLSDPTSAYTTAGTGPHFALFGRLWTRRLRQLAMGAHAASYVNGQTLPRLFPVAAGTPYEAVSSIRLHSGDVVPVPRVFGGFRGPIRLISVGALSKRKRPCDLLAAAGLLRARGIAAEVHFAGEGPERERVEATAARLGLSGTVHLHGHVADRSRLVSLLDECDLFALPSASEGLPRAALEAMSRGLPAVGTRIQGLDEILRPAELFEVGDVERLAAIVERLYRDPGALSALSAQGLETVRSYCSEALSPKRIRLYTALRHRAELGTAT